MIRRDGQEGDTMAKAQEYIYTRPDWFGSSEHAYGKSREEVLPPASAKEPAALKEQAEPMFVLTTTGDPVAGGKVVVYNVDWTIPGVEASGADQRFPLCGNHMETGTRVRINLDKDDELVINGGEDALNLVQIVVADAETPAHLDEDAMDESAQTAPDADETRSARPTGRVRIEPCARMSEPVVMTGRTRLERMDNDDIRLSMFDHSTADSIVNARSVDIMDHAEAACTMGVRETKTMERWDGYPIAVSGHGSVHAHVDEACELPEVIKFSGKARGDVHGRADALLWERSSVVVGDHATVQASGHSTAYVKDDAVCMANHDARVIAVGRSHVSAHDASTVALYGDAHGDFHDRSQGVTHDRSTATVHDQAKVRPLAAARRHAPSRASIADRVAAKASDAGQDVATGPDR